MEQVEKRIAVRTPPDLAPSKMTLQDVKDTVEVIKLAEELVMTVLEPGIDWGLHPGTTSYALKDPGAAKIINAFRCYADPDIISHVADDKEITFVIKGKLIHRITGEVMGTGVSSCSSLETKYRYRWVSAEDLERDGIEKKGLKTKRPKYKGGELLYRVPNPEWEELQNTILKMACKRFEVDAAQGLPGVGTALGKLFGHPVERTYRWFWPLTKRLGFPDEASVHKALSVASMKDWLTQGKKLDEAIEVLISISIRPPEGLVEAARDATDKLHRQAASAEPLEAPAAGAKELPADQRLIAWNIIKNLLKETKVEEASVIKWFKDHYTLDVLMADFDQGEPPDKFTGTMLSRFHDSLFKYKEDMAQKSKG